MNPNENQQGGAQPYPPAQPGTQPPTPSQQSTFQQSAAQSTPQQAAAQATMPPQPNSPTQFTPQPTPTPTDPAATAPIPQQPKKFKFDKKFFIIGGSILAALIVIICVILLIVNRPISRTVMIYMAGSDLESRGGLATVDLESISPQKIDEKTNVVLIAGGAETWDNNFINPNETSIYELQESGFQKVKQQKLLNMGDANTLSNFLTYVYDNYKTEKYDLIFWDHGAAMLGNEFDKISNDNLLLSELGDALENSPFTSGRKLELLIFRTCLNGTIEMADTFKDHADYMVASEEVTYGSNSTSVLNFLNNITSKDSAVDVGKKYIDAYREQIIAMKENSRYFGNESSIYSTYSVLDLAKIPAVEKSLNEFAESLDSKQSYATIAKARGNLYQYASDESNFDMVDLYNLVDSLKDLSESKANALLSSLESAIVYNWATNEQSRGVSIYFPYRGAKRYQNQFLDYYKDLDGLSGYSNLISQFASTQQTASTSKSYSLNDNKTFVAPTEQGFNFSIELTDEQAANFGRAKYLLMRDRGNGYYEPVYIGNAPSPTGNVLTAPVGKRALQVRDRTDPGFKYAMLLTEEAAGDDYINYNSIATLSNISQNRDVKDWQLLNVNVGLQQNLQTGEIGMSSLKPSDGGNTNDSDMKLASAAILDLSQWERIEFINFGYKLVDADGNFHIENWSKDGGDHIGQGVEINVNDFYFELADFTDDLDKYYGVFCIHDINNNVYYSKVTKVKGE